MSERASECQEPRQAANLHVFTSSLRIGALTRSPSSCCGKLLGLFIDGCSMAPV